MASAKPLSRTKPEAKGGGKGSAARKPVQKKLEVGGAGDHFEREADHVARQVVRGGSGPVAIPPTISPLGVQRKKMAEAAPKKEEEKKGGKGAAGARVQRKPAASMPRKEDDRKGSGKGKKAQRKEAGAASSAGGTASAGVESAIGRMQAGSGSMLDSGTRSFMESRFGRDFSGVRVHDGRDAASAAGALNARAFTVGQDVFFNAGQYSPHSNAGRELLAHELTHTVQQAGTTGVAARKLIQRADGKKGPDKLPVPDNGELAFKLDTGGPKQEGVLKTAAGQQEIVLPYLNLPILNETPKGTVSTKMTPVAQNGTPPAIGATYSLPKKTPREGVAVEKWRQGARNAWAGDLASKLDGKLPKAGAGGSAKAPPASQALQMANGYYVLGFASPQSDVQKTTFLFGTVPDLAKADPVLVPRWSRGESAGQASFQADHILELQLGGADSFENMWLLDADYNGRIGPAIAGRILGDIGDAVKNVRERYDLAKTNVPDASAIRTGWTVTFADVRGEKRFGTTSTFWTPEDIHGGKHLEPLKFLTSADLKKRGFKPRADGDVPSKIYIFPTPNGGVMRTLDVGKDGTLTPPKSKFLFPNMTVEGGKLGKPGGDVLASVMVNWRKAKRDENDKPVKKKGKIEREDTPKTIDLAALPNFYDVGYVTPQAVYQARDGWDIPGASPVTFSTIGLDQEGYLVGNGVLSATKALLPKLQANLVMDPTEIRIDFPIPMESFSLGPVTITSLAMSLGIGESGPFLRGAAGFAIATLGTGSITADVTKEGPVIKGRFDLALDFLDKAFVDVEYKFATDELIATGTLSVQKGRLPGIESGTVTVTITRDAVGVDGTINLAPPLAGATVIVSYSRDKGLRIGAENIPLPLAKLPAVQNATLSVAAAQNPQTGEWSFSGAGQATLAVPGATGQIAISYLDGMVIFHTTAQVAKGPANGTLDFTATNGTVDDKGAPAPPPTDTITAWGKGSVTIKFGSVIQGTAGIELTPENSIILSGEIALPPVYEVFPRYDYKKDLLHLEPPEFPIWGVSIAGHGIGVFAFVDARISFDAFVGPGQIRNAAISATMDLDHPDQATVHGHGEFYVPAFAGLNLDVGGGLRARAAIAFAEGRVGLTGQLGIEADASAGLDIDWSPTAGLAVETKLAAHARPKFNLFANASVTVGVDLLVTDISHTFGPWVKQLGSFGPDMELGVEFPVRWSEAKGLDLSLDNIVIQKPSLDAPALMSSVFDAIAG